MAAASGLQRPFGRPMIGAMRIVGIVLAGGLGRRMGGGDKGLRLLAGRPLLAHVIQRARPQVAALALGANGDPARFAAFGLPVVPDSIPDFAGPLAGLLAGLDWAAESEPRASHVASFAGDTPLLPLDLVSRLAGALADPRSELAVAASGGRVHPVFGLWPVAMRAALRRAIEEEGLRRAGDWVARHRAAAVDFPAAPVDPFFNVNRPEDLAAAERLLTAAAAEREPPRLSEARLPSHYRR